MEQTTVYVCYEENRTTLALESGGINELICMFLLAVPALTPCYNLCDNVLWFSLNLLIIIRLFESMQELVRTSRLYRNARRAWADRKKGNP